MAANVPIINSLTIGLFRTLLGRFNDNMLREIVLASVGLKLSRTCMDSDDLAFFLPHAEHYGLSVAVSESKFTHRPDIGKGGWSNAIEREFPPDYPEGQFNVYCASSAHLAMAGLTLEEASSQDEFGSLLSIPACCRAAYLRFHPIAARKQNDFVPLVLDNTTGNVPYNYWTNYVSQYFGRALLSFFPCSFHCARAVAFAQLTFAVLQQCSRQWAEQFVHIQRNTILYTEYLGLHLLWGSRLSLGWIDYNPARIDSTAPGEIHDLLVLGNRLRSLGKHGFEVYTGNRRLARLEDEDISLCLFS